MIKDLDSLNECIGNYVWWRSDNTILHTGKVTEAYKIKVLDREQGFKVEVLAETHDSKTSEGFAAMMNYMVIDLFADEYSKEYFVFDSEEDDQVDIIPATIKVGVTDDLQHLTDEFNDERLRYGRLESSVSERRTTQLLSSPERGHGNGENPLSGDSM